MIYEDSPAEDLCRAFKEKEKEFIAEVAIMPTDEDFVILEILRVVGERRKGHGTRAMTFLVSLADQYGVIIEVDPFPLDDAITEHDLRVFYRGFGFEDHGEWMLRYPS